jgi:dTDP-glucose pyrophosphorylase
MNVTRVAEKDPISDWATVGYYYYKDGRVFESAVDQMIRQNDRVNNEFYTCPAYNHVVNRRIKAFEVAHMQGLGTPEDLDVFHSTQGQYDWPTTNF